MPTFRSTAGRTGRSLWVVIPPPLLFVAAFGIGLLLDRAFPSPVILDVLARARFVGLAAVVIGLLLTVSAAALFVIHRTTIVPHGSARLLVTGGPYRLTRNPMYLGLTLIYLASAILARSPGALVMLLLPLFALQRRIIPYEERILVELFGDDFRKYASGTRRWI